MKDHDGQTAQGTDMTADNGSPEETEEQGSASNRQQLLCPMCGGVLVPLTLQRCANG
jgi:hypothetical protein